MTSVTPEEDPLGVAATLGLPTPLRIRTPILYVLDNFRPTFWTPFEDYRKRMGQPFTVLGRHTEAERALAAAGTPDFLYRIRFLDGEEISAWGEEVCQDSPTSTTPPPHDHLKSPP